MVGVHNLRLAEEEWVPLLKKALKIKGRIKYVYVRSIIGKNELFIEYEDE